MKMVSDTSSVGEGTVIMPGAFVGNHVSIGKNCVIRKAMIGSHAVIPDNSVIDEKGEISSSENE